MNRELYTLLMQYKNKEIDNYFINKSFDIMMKYETITDYIYNMQIINEGVDILGSYSNEKRSIIVNKEAIINDPLLKNKKISALHVLRHEIEHARNLQRIYERRNDIETRVIRYSLRDYAINHNLYYGTPLDRIEPHILRRRRFEKYNIDPGERIAEIKSSKFLVNLLKNQRRTNDLLAVRSMLFYSYIRGYQNNGYYLEPPTYEYLLALGLYYEHKFLKKDFNKKNYNLNTRLLCGLPISYEEYDKEILKKVLLKKKRKN